MWTWSLNKFRTKTKTRGQLQAFFDVFGSRSTAKLAQFLGIFSPIFRHSTTPPLALDKHHVYKTTKKKHGQASFHVVYIFQKEKNIDRQTVLRVMSIRSKKNKKKNNGQAYGDYIHISPRFRQIFAGLGGVLKKKNKKKKKKESRALLILSGREPLDPWSSQPQVRPVVQPAPVRRYQCLGRAWGLECDTWVTSDLSARHVAIGDASFGIAFVPLS